MSCYFNSVWPVYKQRTIWEVLMKAIRDCVLPCVLCGFEVRLRDGLGRASERQDNYVVPRRSSKHKGYPSHFILVSTYNKLYWMSLFPLAFTYLCYQAHSLGKGYLSHFILVSLLRALSWWNHLPITVLFPLTFVYLKNYLCYQAHWVSTLLGTLAFLAQTLLTSVDWRWTLSTGLTHGIGAIVCLVWS